MVNKTSDAASLALVPCDIRGAIIGDTINEVLYNINTTLRNSKELLQTFVIHGLIKQHASNIRFAKVKFGKRNCVVL